MSGSNFNVFRDFPAFGRTTARQTFANLAGLRRALGTASLSGLLLYGSLPVLTLLGAVVSLIVPMVLGPASFGQYSLVEALFRYGVAFDLGLSLLVDRRLPVMLATVGEIEEAKFASSILWLRLYIAAAVTGFGALALPILSAAGALRFPWPFGVIALLAGALGMLMNGPSSIERARSHRAKFALLYAGGLAVLSVGRLLGVLAGGVLGCFAVMGVCYAALVVRPHWRLLRLDGRPDAVSARAFFRESVPLFLTIYTYTLFATANRWVVGSQIDAAVFGQFAFGSSVVTLSVGMMGGMAQLWYPRLARRRAGGEVLAVSRRVLRDLAVLIFGMGAVSVAGVTLGPWLIAVFYPKFMASKDVIEVMLAGIPAFVVATWLMPLSLATGAKPWLDGVLIYVSALLTLVATTEAGFWLDGPPGAAWGLVVTMPLLVGLQLWRLHAREVLTRRDAALLFVLAVVATIIPVLFAL